MKKIIYLILIVAFVGCKESGSPTNRGKNKTTLESFKYRKLTDQEKLNYKVALQSLYDSVLGNGSFNGAILVAKNGEVLLEEYKGYINLATKDTIDANSTFHVASVSKTFTATAILKLYEEQKLDLEDSIQKYFPGFPYEGVTIKNLLNHRSGLPNYIYFMGQDPEWRKRMVSNADILQYLMEKKPTHYGFPDRGFHYCNTNYALLALLVEKISGQPFPEYMTENIFAPLGMTHTRIFTIADTATYVPSYGWNNSVFGIEQMDCVYGDKNVYTTARDLLLWDKGLYDNKIISAGLYKEATEPYSFEKPSIHNYGLGWRLMIFPGSKIVYHTGWWHGNNATFTRFIQDTAVVIIVGNKFNRNIYAGPRFARIFNKQATDVEKQIE
ncbi:MAG: beta-lactamase [Segetibacter sp.]|nr:beta-lactamase [Segetibacter sp.]